MSTQTTTNGSNHPVSETKIKRFLSYGLMAIVSIVIVLIIGFTVFPKMSAGTVVASQPVQSHVRRTQFQRPDLIAQELRPLKAEAARYTGLAEFYGAAEESHAWQAETDRYTGLAEFYGTIEESRSLQAETARYTGLAGFYGAAEESHAAWQAEAARYTGLAGFYSPNTSSSLAANPELMVAQRYMAAVDNETGEPAMFDIEALRTQYFDDWGIEAQAPDVRSVINPIKDYVSGQPATFDIEALRAQYFKEWGIEADTVDTSLTHSHSVILADNPELSLASRYGD